MSYICARCQYKNHFSLFWVRTKTSIFVRLLNERKSITHWHSMSAPKKLMLMIVLWLHTNIRYSCLCICVPWARIKWSSHVLAGSMWTHGKGGCTKDLLVCEALWAEESILPIVSCHAGTIESRKAEYCRIHVCRAWILHSTSADTPLWARRAASSKRTIVPVGVDDVTHR